MTRTRGSKSAARAVALTGAGLLAAGALLTLPVPALAETARARPYGKNHARNHGSIRHSTSHHHRAATRTTARRSYRAGRRRGYRAGYRHGRHAAWHDAWRDYRRWRWVTGLFRLGVYLATRPPQTTTVVVTGTTYYYSGGVYFVQSGSGYTVVAPPSGAVVYAVPAATTVVYVGSTPYYYGGTFYSTSTQPAEPPPPADTSGEAAPAGEGDQELADVPMTDDENSYEVVAPPPGATVPYVPDEATETTVNGKTYFVYDDTYYKPFSSEGETIYMVVEDPRRQA